MPLNCKYARSAGKAKKARQTLMERLAAKACILAVILGVYIGAGQMSKGSHQSSQKREAS